MNIISLKEKVLQGKDIDKKEALFLAQSDLDDLAQAADEIRKAYHGNDFDMCGVIAIKGGRCSEDCRFCAQSRCSTARIDAFPLLSTEKILEHASLRDRQGVRHYCLVSSGRKLNSRDVDALCETIRAIREKTNLYICASLGLQDEESFRKLKDAGLVRIHNNLETSRRDFPRVCTSHTYDEKIATIKAAKNAGLEICCGGIIGTGESMEDRIDMALAIRELDVQTVPINLLDPVPGTPLGNQKVLSPQEVRRVIALYRFLLPKTYVRLAAGRDYIPDSGISCFTSGCNATITGDMLTVKGISVEQDLESIRRLGYAL